MGKTIIHKCFYCERKLGFAPYGSELVLKATVDHIIPRIRGGKNGKSNLVECCHVCNELKTDLLLPDFIERVQKAINKDNEINGIPIERLMLVVKNANILLQNNNENPNIKKVTKFIRARKKNNSNNIKNAIDPYKKEQDLSIVGTYLNKIYGSPSTPSKERILFLQSQTVEQFMEKKNIDALIKRQLSAPDPNFHYSDTNL